MEEKEIQAAREQPESNEAVPPAAAQAGAGGLDEPRGGTPAGTETLEPDAAEPEFAEQFLAARAAAGQPDEEAVHLKAVLEAIVYVLNEPMPAVQIAQALDRPVSEVEPLLRQLAEETSRPDRGIFVREVAGGFQMATKPEHHEILRNFVKNLKQPLKLSQAALETLAVIAYKQPITMPEILEIRGVQGGGVVKTLLDRKLITTAGRKNVIGRPILYKTTKEFLTQFGLKDLGELPSLKEFEEIRRQSIADEELLPLEAPAPPPEGAPQEAGASAPPAEPGAPAHRDGGAAPDPDGPGPPAQANG